MKRLHYNILCIIALVVLVSGLMGLTDNMRERTTTYIFTLVAAAALLGYSAAKLNGKR